MGKTKAKQENAFEGGISDDPNKHRRKVFSKAANSPNGCSAVNNGPFLTTVKRNDQPINKGRDTGTEMDDFAANCHQ